MITVDIDSPSKAKLLSTYRKALSYGRTKVTKTAHGGFHLRIDSDIEDPLEIIRIRRLLGDDPKRIEHDKILILLGHPELANRLFEAKKVNGKYVKERPFEMEGDK